MGNSYETILVERRGGVAIITINRPENRNALNIQTRAEGAAVLDELRADDAVRVVKAYAERHGVTLGEAVSELVRKAVERPLTTDERSGLRVVRLTRSSPRVAASRVNALLDDLP